MIEISKDQKMCRSTDVHPDPFPLYTNHCRDESQSSHLGESFTCLHPALPDPARLSTSGSPATPGWFRVQRSVKLRPGLGLLAETGSDAQVHDCAYVYYTCTVCRWCMSAMQCLDRCKVNSPDDLPTVRSTYCTVHLASGAGHSMNQSSNLAGLPR